jgi:Icc-related predicted phosphoesterase
VRLVHISDTHLRHKQITLPDGDILVHSGDALVRGGVDELKRFAEWWNALPHRVKVYVPGNHDWAFYHQEILASDMLVNTHSLVHRALEIEGIRFFGSPWQPDFCYWAFNLPRGDALRRKWRDIPLNTDVLITHAPPCWIGDRVQVFGQDPIHVGDTDLLDAVRLVKPKYHLFGHVHQAYGYYQNEWTHFYNASICNERYEAYNRAFVIDLKL